MNEFMVFIKDPATGEETDLLYATLGDYQQGIPDRNTGLPVSVWELPLVIVVSGELKVEVSASLGLVTWAELVDAIAKHDADSAAYLYLLGLYAGADAQLSLLELMYSTNVSGNPFTVTFESLAGLVVIGVWNTILGRVEF